MGAGLYWLTQRLADLPDNDAWLAANERMRFDSMQFPKRRNDWKLGRWTAKLAVCAAFSGNVIPLSDIEICSSSDGAPRVLLEGRPGLVPISISHSHEIGFCVIGRGDMNVGCDLEHVEPRAQDFLGDYLTQEEKSFLEQAPVEERPQTSTLIWSAKESILKILHEGLRRDTRSVVISVVWEEGRDPWTPWAGLCLESHRNFYGWWRVCGEYVQTVAADQATPMPEELCGCRRRMMF